MNKFLKWMKKKGCVWQNIIYKKGINYLFFKDQSDSHGGLVRITNEKGEIEKQAQPLLIGYMIEYLIEKNYDLPRDFVDIDEIYNDLKQKIEEIDS